MKLTDLDRLLIEIQEVLQSPESTIEDCRAVFRTCYLRMKHDHRRIMLLEERLERVQAAIRFEFPDK